MQGCPITIRVLKSGNQGCMWEWPSLLHLLKGYFILIAATLSSVALEVFVHKEEPGNMTEFLLNQNLRLPSSHLYLLILLIQEAEKGVTLLTKVFDLITKEKLDCRYMRRRVGWTRHRIQEIG